MLKGIRGALGSIFAFILMALLLISFAIWGIGDIFTSRTLTVAVVGDTEITLPQFLRDFNNRVRTYRQQFGADFTDAEAIRLGLPYQILNERVSMAVLDESARQMGLRANNAQVRAEIQDIEAFEGLLGGFDRGTYVQALSRAGYTSEGEFEELVRRDITRQQLIDALTAAQPVPEFLVDTLYVHRKEQRTAQIMTVPASSVTGVANPDDEELRTFYDSVSNAFQTPEYRSFSYLVLEAGDFAEDLQITDELLREEYNSRLDEYQQPDTREIEAVPFQDEAQAREFAARVAAGEDFVAVATEMTEFTADELSIGSMERYRLENEYTEVAADRIFNLEVGEVSEPVASIFGWNVFRVTGITEGVVQPFEEVREELMNEMVGGRGVDALYDLADRIDDEIATGKGLGEIAEELGLELKRVEKIQRSGLDENGVLSTSPRLQIVLEEAFRLTNDADLTLEQADGDKFYIVELSNVFPAEVRPFEEVRDEVRDLWLNDKRMEIASERADYALTRALAGASFAELAAELGGTTFPAPTLQRDSQQGQGGISLAVSNLIFSLADGGVGIEQAATGDGYILARVTSITPGTPEPGNEEYRNLALRLKNEFSSDVLAQYQAAAFKRIEPWTNGPLMTSTFTEDGIMLPGASVGTVLQ